MLPWPLIPWGINYKFHTGTYRILSQVSSHFAPCPPASPSLCYEYPVKLGSLFCLKYPAWLPPEASFVLLILSAKLSLSLCRADFSVFKCVHKKASLRSLCWLSYQKNTCLPFSIQFSSVAKSCPILCDPMNRSTPGLPVRHQLPGFTQTHVHRVSDASQPSHPLSSPSPAPNPSQHQRLFQWVNSSHEVAKVLEFQL